MKYGVSHKDDLKTYRREQSQVRRASDPVRYLINQARYRAKKLGQEFTIIKEDLNIPEYCPIFGISLFFSGGKRTKNSFSLDRVDNSIGYVKGNVRVISFWANQMKGDMSIAQVESLLKYMKGEI